jgi:putative addiction module killer protein
VWDVRQTEAFSSWLRASAPMVQRKVAIRVARVQSGLFGDVKALGGGLSELRIDFGPGYRVYFARVGDRIILLLAGGDKSSQTRDIAAARRLLVAHGKDVES